MSRKSYAVTSALLGAAVFYVIFAVGCLFLPRDNSGVATVLRGLAEACAAFGGICTLKLIGDRFALPSDGEGEACDTENGKESKTERIPLVLRCVGISVACAAVLFGANLLYSRYVYGSSDVPELSLFTSVLILGIIVPISEEIFFRGYMLTYLTSRGVSRAVSLIVSSAAFAMIHDLRVVPFAFFAGLCLGICSSRVKNYGFLVSFASHGIYNTALCIIMTMPIYDL